MAAQCAAIRVYRGMPPGCIAYTKSGSGRGSSLIPEIMKKIIK